MRVGRCLQIQRTAITAPCRSRRFNLNPRGTGLPLSTLTCPTTTTAAAVNPAVPTLLRKSAPRRAVSSPRLPTNVPARYCSHRRMCRHLGGEGGSSMDITKGREILPTNVKPVHYDLTLEPDFEKFSYEGEVTIEYACR